MLLELHNPQTGWNRMFTWDMPNATTPDEYLIAYSIEFMRLEAKYNRNKVNDKTWKQIKNGHKSLLNKHKLAVGHD